MVEASSVIGILGGGQLGMMLAEAGKKLGFKIHIYTDSHDSPALKVADSFMVGEYADTEQIARFAGECQVVTFEFENVNASAARRASEVSKLKPGLEALEVFQNRILEKNRIKDAGLLCAPFRVVKSYESLESAAAEIGYPSILKTAGMGYDGKGQTKLSGPEDLLTLKESWLPNDYVLEAFIAFKKEFSVLAARADDGEFRSWGAIENIHSNHILHLSIVPADLPAGVEETAISMTKKLAEDIGYVGVLCVEFFLTDQKEPLINEVAPRVHNSGHLSIEASSTSQFEQHIRAITGMPLGSASIEHSAAMLNLLGDLWDGDEAPRFSEAINSEEAALHIYGKSRAKAGRKMGHITFKGVSAGAARQKADKFYEKIKKR